MRNLKAVLSIAAISLFASPAFAAKVNVPDLLHRAVNSGKVTIIGDQTNTNEGRLGFRFETAGRAYWVNSDMQQGKVEISVSPLRRESSVSIDLVDMKADGIVDRGNDHVMRLFSTADTNDGKLQGVQFKAFFQKTYDTALLDLQQHLSTKVAAK